MREQREESQAKEQREPNDACINLAESRLSSRNSNLFELSREASEFDESQMRANDDDTMSIEEARDMSLAAVKEEYLLPDRDMTPEELYHAIEQEIDHIYAQD
jgi:hypothetical protein